MAGGGAPETRVIHALTQARHYRDRSPSRVGALGDWARRLVLRAILPYTAHEDRFDEAVVASIAELTRATERHSRLLKALEGRNGDQRP
jgi:hypothetical protein